MRPSCSEPRRVLLLERAGEPAATTSGQATREVPADIQLRLVVNGEPLVTMACLDEGCEELALGFLFTEGFVESLEEVRSVAFREVDRVVEVSLARPLDRKALDEGLRVTSSRGTTFAGAGARAPLRPVGRTVTVDGETLWRRIAASSRASELHREVGGVHSALYEGPQGRLLAEDIGRHNCVDKVAGRLLRIQAERGQDGPPGAGGMLLTSGRIASEILSKCARLGVEIVVSRSAAMASALRLAEEFGLTVIGYARDTRAVLYCGPERLRL